MDEEQSPPARGPKPPDDGDPSPHAAHLHPRTENGTLPAPSRSPIGIPGESTDVDRSLEPLIHRPKVKVEGLLGDTADNGNNNCLSQLDLATPSKSITCQPVARSTPLQPAQPCSTQPDNQPRNGAKPLVHTHSTHCATHHPPHANGRPKLGSLPRAASSTSSSSSSAGTRKSKKLQSNPSITSQGSRRSKGSSKSNSSQIPSGAQGDCCVHCILACLFCEFLTLCNLVCDCATCGSCAGDDSCFCCCCASDEFGDCELPCDMDCGIIDACCESADCLEICMECCGLCFSS
ncbi:uncharacterized protein mdfi [Aplochiton taeniatus]